MPFTGYFKECVAINKNIVGLTCPKYHGAFVLLGQLLC